MVAVPRAPPHLQELRVNILMNSPKQEDWRRVIDSYWNRSRGGLFTAQPFLATQTQETTSHSHKNHSLT